MFKPLLAATCEDMSALRFPLLASPKLDGIRAMVIDGKLVSRTMKPIPNTYVRELFSREALEGLDGELIDGDPTDADAFNRTTRSVMKVSGSPQGVRFHVFDRIGPAIFADRYDSLRSRTAHSADVTVVPHALLTGPAGVRLYEEDCVAKGYEGIMLRDPSGPYKQGRSTMREQVLMKVKRFTDDEAEVIDVVEGEHNGNVAEKDAFGRTKRSSAQAGKSPNGMMGKIVVRNKLGQEFGIGTGFTEAQRLSIWHDHIGRGRDVIGRQAKYRYQAAGMKDVPRFPSFVGFRED